MDIGARNAAFARDFLQREGDAFTLQEIAGESGVARADVHQAF